MVVDGDGFRRVAIAASKYSQASFPDCNMETRKDRESRDSVRLGWETLRVAGKVLSRHKQRRRAPGLRTLDPVRHGDRSLESAEEDAEDCHPYSWARHINLGGAKISKPRAGTIIGGTQWGATTNVIIPIGGMPT